MSSRFRIIIGIILIAGFGFITLTRWVIKEMRPHYLKSMEESVVDNVTLIASLLSETLDGDSIQIDHLRNTFDHAYERKINAQIYDMLKEKINTRMYVTNAEGIVIFDSRDGKDVGKDYSRWNDVRNCLAGDYGVRTSRDNESDDKSSVLYVASPIMKEGKIIGCVTIGKPSKSANTFIKNATHNVIVAAILTTIFVFFLAYSFTHWITIPIRRLTLYAKQIGVSKSKEIPPLEVKSFGRGKSNEFRVLAEALEEMREALEGKHYVEKYVQNLTHEIKSPISTIKGAIELLSPTMPIETQERFLGNIKSETERIGNIIEKMLELSNLEQKKELTHVEKIDIKQIIFSCMKAVSTRAEQSGITLVNQVQKSYTVHGEHFLLEQIFINLLTNAIEFTPQDKTITISVKADKNYIAVKVSDQGTGIPDYAVKKVFDRFYSLARPDSGKKSSGLGLSFVKEAVYLHGGKVTIANRKSGGAAVTVVLPLAKEV